MKEFQKIKDEGIFVVFIGAFNHWVILVVHKTFKEDKDFVDLYFLDSNNMEHLCVLDEDIPDF